MYKFAIQRPITTLMFAIAVMFFGILGIKKIPVALFPNIDFPIIVISTTYPGGSPEIIESKVTDKVEEAVMGIDGVKKITSNSARNVSIVVVEFYLEKPVEQAMTDVIGKISSIKFDDSNIQQPSIRKFDTSGQAIISLFMSSKQKGPTEIMRHADLIVKPILQSILGVGGVQLNGYRERQIRIYADSTLMNKYGITYDNLFGMLGKENLEANGGRIESATKDFSITVDANSTSIKDIANIRIGKDNVRLSDVAVVEDGLQEETTYAAFNNEPGVIFEVMKVSGANELEVADGVYKALPKIQVASHGYEIVPFLDTTQYIRHSIKDVQFDLMLGGVLAVLIVFLFLRSVTITLVAAISLPISILGTFALIEMLGHTLNMMTMMALTLAIGIIIDDAIVVIENIHKKLELGMSKKQAAYEGVNEIAFAIIAISAMLLSVFVPIANMSGIIGKFFASFGVTVALAIVISYVVVITVIPMVSSLIVSSKQSRFYHFTEPFFNGMENFYLKILRLGLSHKLLFSALTFLIFGFSIYVAKGLGMEFMLKEDKSQFYVWLETSPGISIHEMKVRTLALQEAIAKHEEIEYTTLQVGYGSIQSIFKAKIYAKMKPIEERKISQFDMMKSITDELKKMPQAKGLNVFSSEVPVLGGGDSTPFQVTIYGMTQQAVDKSVAKLKKMLDEDPRFQGKITNYHTSTSDIQPEYKITVLRQNADKYGVRTQEIANVVSAAFSGVNQAAYFKQGGKEYKITMRVPDDERVSVDDIRKLQVMNSSGKLMFLDGLVEITRSQSPSLINRYGRQRSVTVYAAPLKNSGLSLGSMISIVQTNSKDWLEEGVNFAFGGESNNAAESAASFMTAIITAFILIYLILAALYESLLEPFIIMITMPLSFAGVFFSLKLAHQPFSMFSFMGLILLIGIVGKNATLLIDVANEYRKKFKAGVHEAIIFAGKSRLRPILMTTIAMVFGMLPLAVATGSGYAMKSPIGISMIGGLLISMFLSLLMVPILYVIVAPIDDKLKRFYQSEDGEGILQSVVKKIKPGKKEKEKQEEDKDSKKKKKKKDKKKD
ncbi:integral membrane component of efflux system [Helicobacter mustelae]|uniref:efflux RND transporter permease subunit n=1 Tax=Helicobacter mustelae TaxID=217 RepID=UPI000DFC8119|nr:efflux RND transporter permease subunit [Helicobacter mustelae]STP12309.1 integral membrane component of efflux system [Helicobacter mustelae]